MIHQSSSGFALVFRHHDLRHEININISGTKAQILISMDYLILLSEKYLHFEKRQKYVAREFFFLPNRGNWMHVLRKYFSNYVYPKDINKKLKEIGRI